jgi:hypothetical protein
MQMHMDSLQWNIDGLAEETELISVMEIHMNAAMKKCKELLEFSHYSFFPASLFDVIEGVYESKDKLDKMKETE